MGYVFLSLIEMITHGNLDLFTANQEILPKYMNKKLKTINSLIRFKENLDNTVHIKYIEVSIYT